LFKIFNIVLLFVSVLTVNASVNNLLSNYKQNVVNLSRYDIEKFYKYTVE